MTIRPNILIAPAKYVQGAGAIDEIGEFIVPLGNRVLAVGDAIGLSVTRAGREQSFGKNNIFQVELEFDGEVSDREIERIASFSVKNKCGVIMAGGGGKVIDAVKAAAEDACAASVIAPTIASNDAPCSALSVIYNEDGTFNRLRPLRRNPDIVLVDTLIIAQAPVRYLVAGMGDALATWFEADACHKSGAVNLSGGTATIAGMAVARLCFDTLMEYGFDAKIACENKMINSALEKVVEANTLLSGLGFENCGVAAAHALSEGFSLIPEIHGFLHGETVAFGLLVQLLLGGGQDGETNRVFRFCHEIGLPVTLGDLNADKVDRDMLLSAAEFAAAPGRPSGNMPFEVTGEMLYDAILAADAMGRDMKAAIPGLNSKISPDR